MYGYIYKTTNLINGKIYVGQKHSKKFKESYLGSGRRLKDSINCYGKEKFKVELLEEIQTKELMDEREIYWISFYNSTNKDIGYNISEGGLVNRTLVGYNNPFYGKHHSDDTRNKMRQNNSRFMLGKHHSEETKIKIGLKHRGKVLSEDTKEKLRLNAKINSNYGMKGKHHSDETKLKMSLSKKNVESKAKGKIHITNDVEDKMIYECQLEQYEKLGWRRGRKKFSKEACSNISNGHKGMLPHNTNKKWINKDGVRKFVSVNDLNEYLSQDWKIGMKE